MKYLYPYECEKEKYSSPNELQAAIDGNRREGRRSSYGAYADLVPRGNGNGGGGGSNGGGGGGGSVSGAVQHAASLSALASHMSHMSPLSLVSRPSALNGNGHHHRPGSASLSISIIFFILRKKFLQYVLCRQCFHDDDRRANGFELLMNGFKRMMAVRFVNVLFCKTS